MEMYLLVLYPVGCGLLGIGFGTLMKDKRWYAFVFAFVGICLILVSGAMNNNGKSASLNILVTGEKYEVVAIYEKYIVTKSVTKEKQLRFIGPTDVSSLAVGSIYIKTDNSNLEFLK